jgi:hypothetical protein
MSADNFYVITQHPKGGYAAVMGFASVDDPDLRARTTHQSFPTIQAALEYAEAEGSEYGVSLADDVKGDLFRPSEQPYGVWIAAYGNGEGAVPFGTEIEALRHAVEFTKKVKFVPYGETI